MNSWVQEKRFCFFPRCGENTLSTAYLKFDFQLLPLGEKMEENNEEIAATHLRVPMLAFIY